MTITKDREMHTVEKRFRMFEWRDLPGAGFSFDCDEAGTVDVLALAPASAENYRKCTDGTFDVRDEGIQTFRQYYTTPAVGRCDCGEAVVLDGDTRGEGIDCACGRIYNRAGQELAPREQWED